MMMSERTKMTGSPKQKFTNLPLDHFEGLTNFDKATDKTVTTSSKRQTKQKSGATFEENMAKIKERSELALNKSRVAIEERVLQQSFPEWNEDKRAVPNPFVRSGLFSVKNSKDDERKFLDKLVLPSLSNYRIEFTGKELQQDDLSVWLFLINCAKKQPIADSVYFTGYQIVTDLGWSINSKSYTRAKRSIERLKVTGLEVSSVNSDTGQKEQAYGGSLIREYSWDAVDGEKNIKWMVRFEPKISLLFLEDTTTLASWEIRKAIGSRHTVAQWLHYYFESHTTPFPISIKKLHELCRSDDSVSSFRSSIKRALDKLIEVEFLSSYVIENDLVKVVQNKRPRLKVSKK